MSAGLHCLQRFGQAVDPGFLAMCQEAAVRYLTFLEDFSFLLTLPGSTAGSAVPGR